MTERDAFEAWARGNLGIDTMEALYPGGVYVDTRVQAAWQAWNARAVVHAKTDQYFEESNDT